MSLLDHVIFDEAHCIREWGDAFRADYAEIGEILWLLLPHIKFVVTTATMNQAVLEDTMTKLYLPKSNTDIIWRNPDRSNIAYAVRKMKYPARSFLDAAFLVPLGLEGEDAPEPFLAFANSKQVSEDLAIFLRNRLTNHLKNKIIWFHSGIPLGFRLEQIKQLKH
ncbi:hypothetical protein K439DRAFT_1347935 [Ramaria rubella]|nr:hypothetical protein K439DRAFT_1347935 [Ramaria rubella]